VARTLQTPRVMRTDRLWLAAFALLIAGCSDSNAQCDCVPQGLQIVGGPDVQQVAASGPACLAASIRCGGADSTYRPGCDYYYITASGQGDCTVDVTFKGGGTQTKTFTFDYDGGSCCGAGYYIQGDSTWVVAPASQDAGQD
jgi:hypothetical protein